MHSHLARSFEGELSSLRRLCPATPFNCRMYLMCRQRIVRGRRSRDSQVSKRRVSGSNTCGALAGLGEVPAPTACLVRALKTASAMRSVELLLLRIDSMQAADGGEQVADAPMWAIFCGSGSALSMAGPRPARPHVFVRACVRARVPNVVGICIHSASTGKAWRPDLGALRRRRPLRALLQPGIHPCDSIVAQVKVLNDLGKRRQKAGVRCEAFPALALSAEACTQALFC